MLVHLLRNAAVKRLAYWRRADRGEPIARVGITATTKMADLTHQCCAELVHTDAEALKMRDDLISANVELAKNVRRVAIDIRRATEHRQRQPTTCLFFMIALISFLRHAADLQPTGMAGAHDAIAKHQLLDRQRLQQWILGQDVRSSTIHSGLSLPYS